MKRDTSDTPEEEDTHTIAKSLDSIFNKEDNLISLEEIIPDNWTPYPPKTSHLSSDVRGLLVQLIKNQIPKKKA